MFKKKRALFALILLPFVAVIPFKKQPKQPKHLPYISYQPGGRLGDCLITYMHAKWIAHKQSCPFLYHEFPFSSKFKLHELEASRHTPEHKKRKTHTYTSHFKRKKTAESPIYNVPYFPENPNELYSNDYQLFAVNWDDPIFLKELRRNLTPIEPITPIGLKPGIFNLALHIRIGSKYDGASQVLKFPMKFPPLSYYPAAIKKAHALINKEPMHVFIFTDAEDPLQVLEKIKPEFENTNISFGCREKDNLNPDNVLIDFFSMTAFDGLIRGNSSYAIAASKITDYRLEVSPASFALIENTPTVYIDKMNIRLK